jgi:protein-S-isoprenylcysteine O-methyltransferase Ste14
MGIATLAFAALHSALASRKAKQAAAAIVGEEKRDAAYRTFFIAQSLASASTLVAYGAQLPKRTVYRLTGTPALVLRLGQAAGVLHLLAGLRETGFLQWAGIKNLQAWKSGKPIPAGPAAQGPEIGEDSSLRVGPIFSRSRHPLNFSGIPILWLTPRLTTRRLAFNMVSTLYFLAGSLHEASRLKAEYGSAYRRYAEGSVPFFWPRIHARAHSNLPQSVSTNRS